MFLRVTTEITHKLIRSANHNIEKDGILATRLCTHKDDVELTNENKLQQLPGLILLLLQYLYSLTLVFITPLSLTLLTRDSFTTFTVLQLFSVGLFFI